MNKTGELIFVNAWIILWLVIGIGYIWGNFAEKSYNYRIKWFKWLMPGKWAEKKIFHQEGEANFIFFVTVWNYNLHFNIA